MLIQLLRHSSKRARLPHAQNRVTVAALLSRPWHRHSAVLAATVAVAAEKALAPVGAALAMCTWDRSCLPCGPTGALPRLAG